jgi:hypothetical protein
MFFIQGQSHYDSRKMKIRKQTRFVHYVQILVSTLDPALTISLPGEGREICLRPAHRHEAEVVQLLNKHLQSIWIGGVCLPVCAIRDSVTNKFLSEIFRDPDSPTSPRFARLVYRLRLSSLLSRYKQQRPQH